MADKIRPDGEIGGPDLPDRGTSSNVTDTYGGSIVTGLTMTMKIGSETKSDSAFQSKSEDQYTNGKEDD